VQLAPSAQHYGAQLVRKRGELEQAWEAGG